MSPASTSRPFGLGMRRGAAKQCPNCGHGKLYRRYLKVAACDACGHDNTIYPADDAPPYFTILLVGHLIVAPMLVFPWIWQADPLLVIAVTLPILAVACLLALPVIKGAVVGLQWALRHTGDPGPGV